MGTEEPIRGRFGSQLSRSAWGKTASRWGLGGAGGASNSSDQSSSNGSSPTTTACNTPAGKAMPSSINQAFCATPKPSKSSTTCRTSSPSPRMREGEGMAPSPGIWTRRLISRRGGAGEVSASVAVQHGGETGRVGVDGVSAGVGLSDDEKSAGSTLWNEFDTSPCTGGISGGNTGHGRELQRKKCTFKVFVVFRGGWCSTSHVLLKGFTGLNSSIKRAGGKVVAITSQTQEQAGRAAREWKLPFQVYGDPSNQLVTEMNRRFDMDCTVSTNDMVTDAYPNGMAQPCVLVVFSDDAQNVGSVLYKWSRWQTIGSLRHDDAWADILKAVSTKTDPFPYPSPTRPPMTPSTAIPTPYSIPPRPPPPSRPLRGVGPSEAPLSRDVSRVIESPTEQTTTWGFAEHSSDKGNGAGGVGITPRNGADVSRAIIGGTLQERGGGAPEPQSVRQTRLPTPRRSLKGAKGFGEVGFSQRRVGSGVSVQHHQSRDLDSNTRQRQQSQDRDSKTPQAGNGFGPLAQKTPRGTGEVHIRAQRTPRNSQQGQPPQTPRRLWPFSSVGGSETFVDAGKDGFSSAAADRCSLAMPSPSDGRGGAGRNSDTASYGNGNRRASASQADEVEPGGDRRSGTSWWGRAGKRGAHAEALTPPPPPPYTEPDSIAPPPYSEALEELEERR